MKSKKWLLIVVGILLVLNLVFFILIRYAKIDKTIKHKLENYLSKRLNAEVEIKDFSFNDKQINVAGFSVRDPEEHYLIDIEQIYIEYKAGLLFFSSFSGLRSIQSIKIFQPYLKLRLHPAGAERASPDIPDLTGFFKELSIYDGRISLEYEDENFKAEQKLYGFSLDLVNSSRSIGNFQVFTADSVRVDGDFQIRKGKLRKFNLKTADFELDTFAVGVLDKIGFRLDLDLAYDNGDIDYWGGIRDLDLNYGSIDLSCRELLYSGNRQQTDLEISNFMVDNTGFNGNIRITDPEEMRSISGRIGTDDFDPGKYLEGISGLASADIELSGTLSDPEFESEISIPELEVMGQQCREVILTCSGDLNHIDIILENLTWDQNDFVGSAELIPGSSLRYQGTSRGMIWEQGDLMLQADLEFRGELEAVNSFELLLADLQIDYRELVLDNLTLEVTGIGNEYELSLFDHFRTLDLQVAGDPVAKTASGILKFSSFDPSTLLDNPFLPLLSGRIDLEHRSGKSDISSSIIVYDQDFGKLNGRLQADLLIDRNRDDVKLDISTRNMLFNYEPLKMKLSARGTLDSLYVKHLQINDEIELSGWVRSWSQPEFSLNCRVFKAEINEYLSYFMEDYQRDNFSGRMDLDFTYDSRSDGSAFGILILDEFRYKGIDNLEGRISLSGNSSVIRTDKFMIYKDDNPFLNLQAEFNISPMKGFRLDGEVIDLELSSISENDDYSGLFNSRFLFQQDSQCCLLDLEITGTECRLGFFEADSVDFRINQRDSLLYIDQARISREGVYLLEAEGMIGYNLIDNTVYPDSNRISILFRGDIVKTLFQASREVEYGSSEAELGIDLYTGEDGLSVSRGWLSVLKGNIKIRDQLAPVDKIRIGLEIENNELKIERFTARMGEGRIRILNRIGYNDEDIYLGMINLGKFLIETDQQGILFHLPRYMPGNSIANVMISGRGTDYLEVKGPVDEMLIYGDISFSNGTAVYPPDTENLLTLFQRLSAETREREETYLPFQLDLMMFFNDNIRYVSYPLDLTVNEGSLLHLKYEDGKFLVTDARFTSEKGTIDIFGTRLQADYVQVYYDQYEKRIEIEASFYKKAPDGTLITLEVTNVPRTGIQYSRDLNFELRSDNPNDSRIDILSLLRYGRRVDEISGEERRTLLQDEVLQIAGIGIESAFVDPLISPVENWIRQSLKLDFFHLQTNLIQNIFNRYSSDETDYILDEAGKRRTQVTSDLFLNNLSIGMGKYISRKLFFDYQARFERPLELAVSSEMGIYHDFSLRYELPYRFRIVYKYKLAPFGEDDSHEVLLERSFKF